MPDAVEGAPEIDGERYFWKGGEDVLFDETYIHPGAKSAMQGALFYWRFVA